MHEREPVAAKRATRKTKPTKQPAVSEPITYKDLRALKIARSRKTLPRGLKVYHDVGDPEIVFKFAGQDEPVLKLNAHAFVGDSLRALGFKVA